LLLVTNKEEISPRRTNAKKISGDKLKATFTMIYYSPSIEISPSNYQL